MTKGPYGRRDVAGDVCAAGAPQGGVLFKGVSRQSGLLSRHAEGAHPVGPGGKVGRPPGAAGPRELGL